MLRLRVVRGSAAPAVARIADGLTLGRAAEADVVLHDPLVSRVHARISLRGDAPWIVDLGSANGTDVNGVRAERSALAAGDRLRLGDAEIVVEPDDGAPAEGAPDARRRRAPPMRTTVRADSISPPTTDPLVPTSPPVPPTASEARDADVLTLLQRFARGAALDADADRAQVLVRATPGGPYSVAGRYPDAPTGDTGPISRALLAQVAREGRPVLVDGEPPLPGARRGRASAICAAISAGDAREPAAAIWLEREDAARPFTARERDALGALAAKAAPSLRRELAWVRWRAVEDPDDAGSAEASLVGESPKFLEMLDVARHVAAMHTPFLLRGEPGTGRRLLARFVHERSRGRRRPFVVVACGELPPGDEIAALFGEVSDGRRRPGLVEDVGFGTLCLAEIASLALPAQAALAEAIAATRYAPLGAAVPRLLRCRVVATTTRSLDQLAAEGTFHAPLAAALSGVTVGVASLAEREGDAALLAEHFAALHGRRRRGRPCRLDDGARRAVAGRAFPGNVAELSNVVERAVLRAKDDLLGAGDLEDGRPASDGDDLSLDAAERAAIARALHAAGGRRGRAAEILGISWPTLTRKIRDYGIA